MHLVCLKCVWVSRAEPSSFEIDLQSAEVVLAILRWIWGLFKLNLPLELGPGISKGEPECSELTLDQLRCF